MKYSNILFLDIETVPKVPTFALLDPHGQESFKSRFKAKIQEYSKTVADISMTVPGHTVEKQMEIFLNLLWHENAALMAEYLQIVSIGFGSFVYNNPADQNDYEFRVKAVVSNDEKFLLNEFVKTIEYKIKGCAKFTDICGCNSDDFDNPILCRRMVINGIKIPFVLDPTGKKPWELSWKDVMKIYGFGEWRYKITLDRLCYALGVPTPKGDMNGAMVKDFFYGAIPGKEDLPFDKFDKEEDRFKAIGTYQCGDIVATANCFLRLNNDSIIPEHKIKYV